MFWRVFKESSQIDAIKNRKILLFSDNTSPDKNLPSTKKIMVKFLPLNIIFFISNDYLKF